VVKVFIKEDQLMAKIPGQPDYTLLPSNKDEFTIKGIRGYRVKFEINGSNEVVALILNQPNGEVRAARTIRKGYEFP